MLRCGISNLSHKKELMPRSQRLAWSQQLKIDLSSHGNSTPPGGKVCQSIIRPLDDQQFCACVFVRKVFGINAFLRAWAVTPPKI